MKSLPDLHIVHVLNSTEGGSAESTLQLIAALARQGVASSLICHKNGTAERREVLSQAVEGRAMFVPLFWTNKRIRAAWWKRWIIRLRDQWLTAGGKRYLKKMARFAQEHGATHVHTATLVNNEGAYLAQRLGLPHLWHGRELIGPKQPYRFPNFKRWAAFVADHSDVIIANSQVTLDNYRQYFPEVKLWYWPNSLRVEDFPVHTLHEQSDTWRIGMVAHLTSRLKRHEVFAEMAGLLHKKYPGLTFHLFGKVPPTDDPYLKRIKSRLVDHELVSGFAFEGPVAQPQAIMEKLEVLVHPFEGESFGRVILEAMASGLPVVGVDGGGARELISNEANGYRVPVHSRTGKQAKALAEAVEKLIKQPETAQAMGRKGRQTAELHFDLDALTVKLVEQYQTLQLHG